MTAVLILFAISLVWLYLAFRGGLDQIARHRKYKSGTTWCFWRWTDTDSAYILRLHVFKTPWNAVCLHWIRKPDAEPYLHDHPVTFLSIVLRGKYGELRQTATGPVRLLVHRWFNFVRASEYDKHRIIFTRKNTLTLCFMGPKTREWGFHMPYGWLYWKSYYERQRAAKAASPTKAETKALLDEMDAKVDALALKFQSTYVGPTLVTDEDARAIDTAPADKFVAEEPTNPRVVSVHSEDHSG